MCKGVCSSVRPCNACMAFVFTLPVGHDLVNMRTHLDWQVSRASLELWQQNTQIAVTCFDLFWLLKKFLSFYTGTGQAYILFVNTYVYNMYIYIYRCMYVYCTFVYLYIYIRMILHMHLFIYLLICLFVFIHVFICLIIHFIFVLLRISFVHVM